MTSPFGSADLCQEPRSQARLGLRGRASAVLSSSLLLVLAVSAPASGAQSTIHLEQMTFVLAEGDRSELVLTAQSAEVMPGTSVAELREVTLTVAASGETPGFQARCSHGRLNLVSQDFEALAPVAGHTGDGREFLVQRLTYDHAAGRFSSERPIVIEDAAGRIEGGGFEFSLHDRRFTVRSGSKVVAEP